MRILLIALLIFLSACKPCAKDEDLRTVQESKPQFELGDVVYKKINNEKVIIIQDRGISKQNGTRLYRVSTEKDTDYFYEFELVKEIPTQTADSRNEIRY